MLKVYNSYSDKIEEFKPIEENKVKMYVCGPTVYDFPHLGHARCYITWDMVYRYLKFNGFDVKYCRNVTDVDDKILNKADNENSTQEEISKKYYDIFAEDMKALNTLKPDFEPFATKTLGEMIKMVQTLIEKDFAYEVDGDVYFRVKKFKDYGKLSKQPLEDLEAGIRVETTDKKETPLDFALWKKDERHGYNSPWGKGRPGWHIECSAMSKKHLGDMIDIHAGGADLIFPHHENEIAQSECANDCKYVKYWLHNGFVTINKEKMSKSLKNFVSIRALLEKYDSNTIRLFILTNHYRMPVEFNDEALSSAKAGFKRLQNAVSNIKNSENAQIKKEYIEKFKEAMNEDFNSSKALAVLFDLANCANKLKDENNIEEAQILIATLLKLADVLGFSFELNSINEEDLNNKLKEIKNKFDFLKEFDGDLKSKIIQVRTQARQEKNWTLADEIRNELANIGIKIIDTKEGSSFELI